MQDLFGQDLEIYRGQQVANVTFSTDESDKITDDLIFDGLLLKQMAESLKKLKSMKNKQGINVARREAWDELMWVFDLWHTPALVPFDLACGVVGAKSDLIRCAVSHEFADEIRLMFKTITAKMPDERQRLISKLHGFIDLRDVMH